MLLMVSWMPGAHYDGQLVLSLSSLYAWLLYVLEAGAAIQMRTKKKRTRERETFCGAQWFCVSGGARVRMMRTMTIRMMTETEKGCSHTERVAARRHASYWRGAEADRRQ